MASVDVRGPVGLSLTYIFTCPLLALPSFLSLTLPILPLSVTMLLIRQIDTGVGQNGLKLSQAACGFC